jgi:tetratricopeptide (TPR) repeat protein
VRNGNGAVLVVTGDAGIGKSRLVAEAVQSAKRREFAVFGGASRSHGTTISYLVWRSLWRDLLGLDTSLPIAEQQARLVDRLSRCVNDAARRAPLLAPILNLPLPDSPLTAPLDPQTRDGLLRTLLLVCLADVAASAPTLLVLEDCHWIDPASAGLLEFLARNIADRPVLMLVTARGSVADTPTATSLSRLAHSSELHLADLRRSEAELLVDLHVRKRYPADMNADRGVIARIAEQGDGNPFYLEELVNYLHARSVDLRDALALGALDLPDGLQRLLTARLDQLSEGEKATIKVASVIGRRFRASWIADAYPGAGGLAEVVRHLERLHQLDLTPRRSTAADPEYQFKHAMTQETAYQSLTFRLRESLHERVGLLIESANPGRLGQYVDVLAHHYGRTQRVDKQQLWFRAAGDAAKTAFANDTAVDYYQRLLLVLPEAETGEVLIELGGVWQLTGEWAEAERAYRKAMEVASATGRSGILAAGERDLGDLFTYNRSHAEAVAWLRRAADRFDRLGDRAGLSRTLESMTFALYRQGAYDEALATAEQYRTLASASGDLVGVSNSFSAAGLVHLETGHLNEARDLLHKALETATKVNDRRCLLYAANNLALLHLHQGEHVPAVAQGLRALEVAQEIGFLQTAGVVVGNLGEVYRNHGDYVPATRCFAHALRIALDLRDWTTIGDQVANLAATAAAQGLDLEAERLFGRAIAIGRHLDAPYLLCSWLHRLATLHVEQGCFEEAERLNQEALEIAETHDERGLRIRAFVLEQRLSVVVGRSHSDESVAHLRELEGACTEPIERALVFEAIWRLDPTAEAARSAAAHLYRELYERTPAVEYRAAHRFLTGVTLPAAPPLPSLPAPLDEDTADVDELLQQVDRITPQIAAVADVRSGAALQT